MYLAFLFFLLLLPLSFAHGDEQEKRNWGNPVLYIEGVGVFLLIMTALITMKGKKLLGKNASKKVIFWIIALPVALSSMYLGGHTIYENLVSVTRGPVHWHADFQVWNCGERIDLENPGGLLNRVGSASVHEHGDGRIHVEGTLETLEEAELQHFFKVTGGLLTKNVLQIKGDEGVVEMKNNNLCNNGEGKVQIFAYKILDAQKYQREGFIAQQIKVDEHYILSPYGNVPPGDCIIIEFDQEKERTDKLCDSYQVALEQGKMRMER